MTEPVVIITIGSSNAINFSRGAVAINNDEQIVFDNQSDRRVSLYNQHNGRIVQHLEPRSGQQTVQLSSLTLEQPYLMATALGSPHAYLPFRNVVRAETQTNSATGQDELVSVMANVPMTSETDMHTGVMQTANPSCPNPGASEPNKKIWVANYSGGSVCVTRVNRDEPSVLLGTVADGSDGSFDVNQGDEIELSPEETSGPSGRTMPKITIEEPDCGDEVR